MEDSILSFLNLVEPATPSLEEVNNYLQIAKGDPELASNFFKNDHRGTQVHNYHVRREPIDLHRASRALNVFDALKAGSEIDLQKKKMVEEQKKFFDEAFEFYQTFDSSKIPIGGSNSDQFSFRIKEEELHQPIKTPSNLQTEHSFLDQIEGDSSHGEKLKKWEGVKKNSRAQKKQETLIKIFEENKSEAPASKKRKSQNEEEHEKKPRKVIKPKMDIERLPDSIQDPICKRKFSDFIKDRPNGSDFDQGWIYLGYFFTEIKALVTVNGGFVKGTKFGYKHVTLKDSQNFNKKPAQKNKKEQKTENLIYLTYQNREVDRIREAELKFSNLFSENLVDLDIHIIDDSNFSSHYYTVQVEIYLSTKIFTQPLSRANLMTEDIGLLSETYAKLRISFQNLFDLVSLHHSTDSPFNKIHDDKVAELLIKNNFYQMINNFSSASSTERDLGPYGPASITLHDFQKMGINWLINKESLKTRNSKGGSEFLSPMWIELQVEFKLGAKMFEGKNENQIEDITSYFRSKLIEMNHKNFLADNRTIFFYLNVFSGQLTFHFPSYDIEKPVLGGILADDMGLGKTVMILSLINFSEKNESHKNQLYEFVNGAIAKEEKGAGQKNEKKPKKINNVHQNFQTNVSKSKHEHKPCLMDFSDRDSIVEDDSDSSFDGKLEERKIEKVIESEDLILAGTLIIMPSTLIHQWSKEIERFFPHLSVYIYRKSRSKATANLGDFDIVLTSYGVIMHEARGSKTQELLRYAWLRIVLDEGHRINNPQGKTTKAILRLKGGSRWILTGTPIENSVNDVFSLIAFLNYRPWCDWNFWDKTISKPLYKEKNLQTLEVLKSMLRPILFRRTKQSHAALLGLMPIEYFEERVQLSESEKQFYDLYNMKSQELIRSNLKESFQPVHYWDLIMKMRQICDHQLLLTHTKSGKSETDLITQMMDFFNYRSTVAKNVYKDSFADAFTEDKAYNIISLYYRLEEQEFVCQICMDERESMSVLPCGHYSCKYCFNRWFAENRSCYICRKIFSKEDIFQMPK